MNKIKEFGRKAMFYVRVLSGYEERRIRSFRLQLENQIKEANERKLAMRKLPEQVILSEVRRMVNEMQALNKKLEDTEAAIEDYFAPIDKQAETIMKMQLEGEEKSMKEMMKTMQRQALLEKEEMLKLVKENHQDVTQHQTKLSPDEFQKVEAKDEIQKVEAKA